MVLNTYLVLLIRKNIISSLLLHHYYNKNLIIFKNKRRENLYVNGLSEENFMPRETHFLESSSKTRRLWHVRTQKQKGREESWDDFKGIRKNWTEAYVIGYIAAIYHRFFFRQSWIHSYVRQRDYATQRDAMRVLYSIISWLMNWK